VTKREHHEFIATKAVIERVHRRLGIPRQYLSRDWQRDEKLLRESISRKQALRQEEQALVATFEGWRHGRPVVVADAEPPKEKQQRAS